MNTNRKISDKFKSLHSMATLAFLIACTVGYSTTLISSRIYVDILRNAAICILPILILLLIKARPTIIIKFLFAFLIYIWFLLYGGSLAVIKGGMPHVLDNFLRDTLITIVGIFIFSTGENEIINTKVAEKFLIYILISLIYTVYIGGFIADYPYRFIFEFTTDLSGNKVSYSQGISKLYGLGAIAAIFLAFNINNTISKFIYFSIGLFLIVISLFGGGRGDILATLIVCFVYFAFKIPKKLFFMIFILAFLLYNISFWIVPSDFAVFDRFISLRDGDFGKRDALFLDAFWLFFSDPQCFFVGCGFGYFQTYYQLPTGLYPHNIFIEAIIVWGAPLTFGLGVLTVLGLKKFIGQSVSTDAFLIFVLFFLLIDSKSGTIMGAWVTFSAAIGFSGRAIVSQIQQHKDRQGTPIIEDIR